MDLGIARGRVQRGPAATPPLGRADPQGAGAAEPASAAPNTPPPPSLNCRLVRCQAGAARVGAARRQRSFVRASREDELRKMAEFKASLSRELEAKSRPGATGETPDE